MTEGFIEVITGGLGSGKTLMGVEVALDHLTRGGTVFTNVELYRDKIEQTIRERGYIFDPSRLVLLPPGVSVQDLADHIQRGNSDHLVMVLWDEASFDVNSKDRQKLEREFQDLCTLARKLDLRLILVSQIFNDLDNQIRGRVQNLWVCRNLSKYKIAGLFAIPVPLMFRVCYHVAGFTKPQYAHLEVGFRRAEVARCYNTKALLGKHAGKFGSLVVSKTGPLQRVPTTPDKSKILYYLAALCSSFFASL